VQLFDFVISVWMLDAFPLEPDIIEKKYPNADKYNYNTSVIYIEVSGYNFFS
jgi:hypothetical protein